RIETAEDWRKGYVGLVHEATAASATSADAARRIAADGLASMRSRMVLVDRHGDEVALEAADLPAEGAPFATESVRGTGPRVQTLQVPYRGSVLEGERLRGQLAAWVDAGVVEPSFAAAVGEVIDHPEWLDAGGHRVLLI